MKHIIRTSTAAFLLGGCLLVLEAPRAVGTRPYTTWSAYGGGPDQPQYSALAQINRSNVTALKVAWTYPTGDSTNYLFNPLIVDDVMYVLAKNNSIVALDAATGKEMWAHENRARPHQYRRHELLGEQGPIRSPAAVRSNDSLLQTIDAQTGRSITSFGVNGVVDTREGLGRDPAKISVQSLTPGRVFENLIILGSATNQGYGSAPGDIRAYRRPVREGRAGRSTPFRARASSATTRGRRTRGRPSAAPTYWGEMSIDEKRGIVYIPTASPKYNFYGANRKGANLFGDCLLALDARTGKRLWHFQMVHHDIWDYDNATAPKLLTVRHDGKMVDVVAQAGKTGFLYVFNRVTGKPLWPIEERAVPRSDMPGEETWPTQPFPTAPPPFARQSFTENDLSPFIDDPAGARPFPRRDSRRAQRRAVHASRDAGHDRDAGQQRRRRTWGGAAVDPDRGRVIVVSKDYPSMLRLELGGASSSSWRGAPLRDEAQTRAAAAGKDPATIQYKSGFGFIVTSSGLSAIKPPWTTMTAYDLNAGTIAWQIPLGEVPELAAKGITNTGAHFPKVGPVVTAGGLIFTGTRDRMIRAFDVETGKELWKTQVAAGVEGIPAVYEVKGRQYIVYCVAARATTHIHGQQDHPGDTSPMEGAYVAFALPSRQSSQ